MGVTATIAAASRARAVEVIAGGRRTHSVTAMATSAMTRVITRAAGGLPETAPRNVSGSTRRVIVPPGDWFS